MTPEYELMLLKQEARLLRSLLLRTFGPAGDAMTNAEMIKQLAEDHKELMRLSRPTVPR